MDADDTAGSSARGVDTQRETVGLLALSTPVIAGLVLGAAPGLVDAMVLGGLGAPALGAVSLTSSVTLVFVAALFGLLTPCGLAVARAFGRADKAAARRQFGGGLRVASIAGVLASALHALTLPLVPDAAVPADVAPIAWAYWLPVSVGLLPMAVLLAYKQAFEAIERPWAATGCMGLMVATDAATSAVLVHGMLGMAPLGLLGAGLGNVAGHAVALAGFWLLSQHRWPAAMWLRSRTPERVSDASRQQWHDGLPMGLQYLAETGATAVAGLLVALFGAIHLAGNQIATAVTMTLYMVPLGLATAIGLRVAQAHAAGHTERLWPIVRAGLMLAAAWMGSTGLALAGFGGAVAGWSTPDVDITAAAAALFVPLALMQVADGVQSVSAGALRALQAGAWAARATTLCYWVAALPAAWLIGMTANQGAPGCWRRLKFDPPLRIVPTEI